MDKEISDTFYVMKSFAILSVISAHVNIVDNENIVSSLVTNWYNLFGIIGVICFFIINGYYYKREENDSKIFWKKKLKKIFIPWLIAGTISYVLHGVKIQYFSFFELFKWISGSGTIYYYLPCYTIFLFLFKYISKRDVYLYLCIILNIIQIILNTKNVFFSNSYITWYLNIFEWIGFFSFGILIKKYNMLKLLLRNKDFLYLFLLISIILFCIMYKNNISGYFNILSFLYEICYFIVVFYISYYLRNNQLLKYIGKLSFCIYLYHIQIVQKICWTLPINIFFEIINPILALGLMVILIYLASLLIKRFKYKDCIYLLVGIK